MVAMRIPPPGALRMRASFVCRCTTTMCQCADGNREVTYDIVSEEKILVKDVPVGDHPMNRAHRRRIVSDERRRIKRRIG